VIAVLQRDLVLAFRSGGGFGLALAFFFIVVVLTPFAVGSETAILARIGPGILWLAALLACLLSLDRIFGLDAEDGTLDALVTAPIPLESVVIGKAVAHWLTTGLPVALLAPLCALLLSVPTGIITTLVISLLIGTPALSAIGAFGAALTVGIKRGGLLLSLLVLPLFIPTLIFGAMAVNLAAIDQSVATPMALLAAVSIGSFGILPFAAATLLRVNLR